MQHRGDRRVDPVAFPRFRALTAGQKTFPRTTRLTRPAEFRRVFSRSTASTDRWFRVLWRRSEQPQARLGLAVSRKTCASAVGRNRLKRVVRESFRQHRGQLARNGGIDIVVLPSRNAVRQSNAELSASLEQHWRRCATNRRADASTTNEGKH